MSAHKAIWRDYERYRALLELKLAVTRLRADFAFEHFQRAFLRWARAEKLRRKAGYRPDQPRIPANNPGGGQWTTVAGIDAGNDTSAFASDPYTNRHILNEHVAKTNEELIERIRRSRLRGPFVTVGMDRNGSFDSIESARDFIRRTLDNNSGIVSAVANGQLSDSFVTWRFGFETGKEAYLEAPDSSILIRNTYGVGVAIVHDQNSELGYRIITAYPRNYNPRIGR